MTTYHIMVTGDLHPQALNLLKQIPNTKVSIYPALSKDRLKTLITDVHVLLTRSSTAVDRELMDCASKLMVVARAGVGISNIDLHYATTKNIMVINAPGCNTQSAAELTIALLLAMVRKLPQAYTKLKSGGWDRHSFIGKELSLSTIGLVGLGNVGRRVAKICQGLSMHVQAYDPYLSPKIFNKLGIKYFKDLKQLISSSNILSMHVPKNEETNGMIDLELLKLLPNNSYIINTARGGIIVERDIITALDQQIICGAAIDTWTNEPTPNLELVKHHKVYCTPHIGAVTNEAQISVGCEIVSQISKALSGDIVDYPVNLPSYNTGSSPIRADMILAEKLASLAVQINDFSPLKLFYRTPKHLEKNHHKLISLSIQKGYLHPISNQFISYANVSSLFSAKGIKIDHYDSSNSNQLSVFDNDHKAFDDRSLSVIVVGSRNQILVVSGEVYNQTYPRITAINEFNFEANPDGHFIVFENKDEPGVVGTVGTFLAKRQINIDSFYLSSHNQKGKAMAMVKVNCPINQSLINELKLDKLINYAFSVKL